MTINQDSESAVCQVDFMRRLQAILNTTAAAWAQGSDLPRETALDEQAAFPKAKRLSRLAQRSRFYSFGQYAAHQP